MMRGINTQKISWELVLKFISLKENFTGGTLC